MLVPQTSKGQVCCQEQLATSRHSRAPISLKHGRTLPLPQKVSVWKHRTPVAFTPTSRDIGTCRSTRGMSWTGWDMSYISYPTTVLFEESCLPTAVQSCLTLFPVCNTNWNYINWNNSKLKINPVRVGTRCWIHLNKDCHQKKHLPNHSCDLENCWSVTQFQLLYHRRSFIPRFITQLTHYIILFFQLSS